MRKCVLIHHSGLMLTYFMQNRSFFLTRNAFDALSLEPEQAQKLLERFTTKDHRQYWHLLSFDLPEKAQKAVPSHKKGA